jgi:hypothetical protein
MKFRPSFYSYIQKMKAEVHSTLRDSDIGKHTHAQNASGAELPPSRDGMQKCRVCCGGPTDQSV